MKTQQLTLLFLIEGENVLLAMKKRGFGVGRWNGVGGKVENSETTEAAAIRECQEEISVTPVIFKQVAHISFNELHNNERKIMKVNVYFCTQWTGEPTETEEMRPKWFKKVDIPYDKCWPDDKYWLPLVLTGKKLEAAFVMKDDDEVESYTLLEKNDDEKF